MGAAVGAAVGDAVGTLDGAGVGEPDGLSVGDPVGGTVGDEVGSSVPLLLWLPACSMRCSSQAFCIPTKQNDVTMNVAYDTKLASCSEWGHGK